MTNDEMERELTKLGLLPDQLDSAVEAVNSLTHIARMTDADAREIVLVSVQAFGLGVS